VEVFPLNNLGSGQRPTWTSWDTRVIGGTEAALREFIAQYLITGNSFTGKATIYIGQLPDQEQTIPIPLLDGLHIISSIVRDDGRLEILLAAAAKPNEVLTRYEQVLSEAGWRSLEKRGSRSGLAAFRLLQTGHETFSSAGLPVGFDDSTGCS
jgi:hypothetical protein